MKLFTSMLVTSLVWCVWLGGVTTPLVRAAVITAVGVDSTTGPDWRTTTVAKPYAINGDPAVTNVYGKAGYLALATYDTGTGGPFAVTPAQAVAPGTLSGLTTYASLPSWVTIAVVGTSWNWYSPGAVPFDDPTLTPGPAVADLTAGWLYKGLAAGTNSLFTLTFAANAPDYMRLGIMFDSAMSFLPSMILSNEITGVDATQAVGSLGGPRRMGYVFFDVQGAAGQTLILAFDSPAGSYGISGFTFDLGVPEPSTVLLLLCGSGLVAFRRRSPSPSATSSRPSGYGGQGRRRMQK